MATPGLIGRGHAAVQLTAQIERAHGGRGGLVLVSGEAGIGKSSLVAEAAVQTRRNGALVLSAAAWEGAPGLWPWVQVLRDLRRSATPEEWADARAAAGEAVSFLLGEHDDAVAGDLATHTAFRLHDAVTTGLVTASRSRAVVVVLDDLHWADPASLRLLEFAAQHAWCERLLLVATYRDTETAEPGHPLADLLPPVAARATTIPLTGLNAAQVASLVQRVAGSAPDSDLAADIHRRTGGNPFFVEQIAQLWHSGEAVDATTPAMRQILDTRLSRMPGAVGDVLRTAAVIGRTVDRELLTAATGMPEGQIGDLLGQATAARLLSRRRQGGHEFVHDLVREALLADLDTASRRKAHAALLAGLEDRAARGVPVEPAELARHAYHAVPEVEPSRARGHLVAAAANACNRLATDEVALLYRRALELAEPEDPALRVRLVLELAQTLEIAGEPNEARTALNEAITLGRSLDDPRPLARAVLELHSRDGAAMQGGPSGAEVLNEALRLLRRHGVAEEDPLALRLRVAASAQARLPLVERGDATETVGTFRFDGRVWVLGYAGRTVHVPDAKGLRDLHQLLGTPDRDVAAADLLSPEGGEEVRALTRIGADTVLDEQAKQAYRRRLTDLDEAIEHATTLHDDTRAAQLDAERQAVLQELRGATGLAGRSRRLGDPTERARKTVTARIRDTLRRLDHNHPELAEHLRASVSTGVTCAYRPTRPVAWSR